MKKVLSLVLILAGNWVFGATTAEYACGVHGQGVATGPLVTLKDGSFKTIPILAGQLDAVCSFGTEWQPILGCIIRNAQKEALAFNRIYPQDYFTAPNGIFRLDVGVRFNGSYYEVDCMREK